MNWRIFIKTGPATLREIGEGPFRTKRDAMLFANAEVHGRPDREWFVAKVINRKAKK